MCLPSSFVLWYFVFLLVTVSSEFRDDSTIVDEQSNNSTMQYEFLVDSMKYRYDEMKSILCNSRENSIKKNDEEMQYEFHINSTKNDNSLQYESRGHIKNREESNQMFMEFRANSTENFNESFTKPEDESNSTLYEFGNTDDYNSGHNMATIVSHEACNNVICIQLCCPFGNRLTRRGRCVAGLNNYSFPDVYKCDNDSEDKTLDELFQLTVRDPCVRPGFKRRLLHSKTYLILPNGFLYQGPDKFISSFSYCLAIFNRNIYDVVVCQRVNTISTYVSTVILVSLLFLLLTFVIYSILPELQNIHGYTMCAHVASLFIAEVIIYMGHKLSGWTTNNYCIPLGYTLYFSFLSGFFWLNVICFDIWWTFRKICSRETRVNRDKKKFVIYSIYAWGIPFILTVVCAIIDNVPGIPKNWILPDMCRKRFWFGEHWAKIIYFCIPVSATIISNICFFIATSVTILYQKRDAHQLRDSESRRHDENKQRFNMYLKLFIVMGITWVMQVIVWVINNLPKIVWNLSDFMNPLQNVMLFIIFVCKKKIIQLLLKRFVDLTAKLRSIF